MEQAKGVDSDYVNKLNAVKQFQFKRFDEQGEIPTDKRHKLAGFWFKIYVETKRFE